MYVAKGWGTADWYDARPQAEGVACPSRTDFGGAWYELYESNGRAPYAALRAGWTDNLIPTAFSTAKRVLSVGFPFGDSAR